MTKEQRKIKIGMEVEASDLSESSASPEFKKVLRDNDLNLSWWNSNVTGTNDHPTFQCLPREFRIPDAWKKAFDRSCGMENKFDEPTDSIDEAEKRVDELAGWFSRLGVTQFRCAGTHVHLGTLDWISRNVEHVDSTLGMRARQLLYGYFITRERALFELVPTGRRDNQYCRRGIGSPSGFELAYTRIDKSTPAWAIHNSLLLAENRLQMGGAIMNSRHLPTFEFRMFPGCGSATALKGYVRLVWSMFQNVAPLLLKEEGLKTKNAQSSVFITNPYTFTAKDLKSELSDSWLKTWIDETLDNDGKPISTNISSSCEPQRLATI